MSNIEHKDVGVSSLKGTPSKKIYIKTSTEAVYNPEGVTQEYINNHIDGSKIVDGTVTTSKIANNAVTMSRLGNEVQTLIQQGADSSWTPKGDFNIETTYDANDVVFDPETNSSYLSLRADNMGHAVTDETWWMKVLDGSYVNIAIEEMEAAIAQAIEDAQDDISELISDSQVTIDAAVSGANSAAQAANTAAANANAKIDWVEEQVDSLTAYEVATALDSTSIIPVQNKVVTENLNAVAEVLYGSSYNYTITQGYYENRSGTIISNSSSTTRVKVNTINTLVEGSYRIELNTGYVIRAISVCSASKTDAVDVVSSSQMLTSYNFTPSDENKIYSCITICKTDASASISASEDIIKYFGPIERTAGIIERLEDVESALPPIENSTSEIITSLGYENYDYNVTQGYYKKEDNNTMTQGTLATRVKLGDINNLVVGSYRIELNDGYVIRQICVCDINKANASIVVNSGSLKTSYDFTPSDENKIYSCITLCKTDASANISPSEDIIKYFGTIEKVITENVGNRIKTLEQKIDVVYYNQVISKAVFMGDSITQGVYSYWNNGIHDDAHRYNGFDISTPSSVEQSTAYHGIHYYFGKIAGNVPCTNLAKRGSGYVHDGRGLGNALEVANAYDFSDVDFVALCFGINDYINHRNIGNISTMAVNTVIGNMARVVQKILTDNPLCKVVAYSPYNAWGQVSKGGDYSENVLYGDESTDYALGYAISGNTLQNYVDAIDAVCQHYGIQHVPLSQSNVVNRLTIKNIMIDGLHPSKESYPKLAAEVYGKGNYGA